MSFSKIKHRIKEFGRNIVSDGVERYFDKNRLFWSDRSSTQSIDAKLLAKFQTLSLYLSRRLENIADVQLLYEVLSLRLFNVPLPRMGEYMAFAQKVEAYKHPSPPHEPKNAIQWTRYFDFMDFEELKLPIRSFTYTSSAKIFFSHQYRHPQVHIKKGDHVLDAGALFGDTSLWFSTQAGKEGHIYSFEIVPQFVERIKENLTLNTHIAGNISVHKYALWDKSGEHLSFVQDGGRSHVDNHKNRESETKATTITIDDFIEENNVQRIDFVKMDIEGAELKALVGAKKTLQRFKPKLAICLYHRNEDFVDIPMFLDSFCPWYKFYLGHHTDFASETVLYACVD